MSYPIVKLLHGSQTLNLMDAANSGSGRYKVSTDFAPPSAQRSVVLGYAPRGSAAVEKRLVNTEFTFSVHIKARSDGELERGKRELQSFLNRAGDPTPLYLAYRSFNDYDYEPFFGLHGAYARYEIVHGYLDPSPIVTNSKTFIGVRVNLVIKPQAVFPAAKAGQATGFVFEDYVGRPNGRARGTSIAGAITNKHTNPTFAHGTWNNGWTATGTGFTVTQNTDPRFVLFGLNSARCSKTTVAAGDRFTQSLTLSAETHYFSCYIKMIDESTPSGVNMYYNGSTIGDTTTAVGDGWYRLTASATGTGGAAEVGITATSTTTPFFVDGFQVTITKQQSNFVFGDFLGCTWAGTKNASTSTSTAGRLRYLFGDFLGVRTGWTMRFVWVPNVGTSGNRFLIEDSDSAITVLITSANLVRVDVAAANTVSSAAITITAGTAIVFHVTYDGSTVTIYKDGASLATGVALVAATADPTYIYVGSDNAAANQLGGTLMDASTFQRPMTAAAVLADYNSLTQQVTDGDRISPLPWLYTVGGDSIIDNDNYSVSGLYCYAVVGGLMGDDVDIAYKLDSSQSFVLGPGVTWGSLPVRPQLFDKDIVTGGGTNTLLFIPGDGTVDTDANGDAVTRISLGTSESSAMSTAITEVGAKLLREAAGVVGYFVAKDAGTRTNVQVKLQITSGPNSENYYETGWKTLATSAAFRPFVTAELPLDFEDPLLDSSRKLGFRFVFKRTAGASTENFDISHAIWLTNYSAVWTGDVGATNAVDMCYVRDRLWEGVDDASPLLTIARRIFNRPLVIRPEHLNVLMLQHTFNNYAAGKSTWATGYNLEVEQFAVTPRFDIY